MCCLLIFDFDFSGVTWGYCLRITAYQVPLPWQRFDNQLLLVATSCRCCYFRQAYWLFRRVDFIHKTLLFRQNLPATSVQDVEKLWVWMCLRQLSMLCHFCLFFKLCSWCFNSPVATPAHGLHEFRPSLRLWLISENANLLALYFCATAQGSVLLH